MKSIIGSCLIFKSTSELYYYYYYYYLERRNGDCRMFCTQKKIMESFGVRAFPCIVFFFFLVGGGLPKRRQADEF
jgi:hypothetical protein